MTLADSVAESGRPHARTAAPEGAVEVSAAALTLDLSRENPHLQELEALRNRLWEYISASTPPESREPGAAPERGWRAAT